MLSRYRIGEKLGAGGMGVVHRAEDLSLHRPVALKFLSATSLSQEQTRARFLREARTAAALNHPNVCTIHEVGEVESGEETALGNRERLEAGTPFIAMELVEGRTLEAMVRESGSIPFEDLIGIAMQISDGLAAAHARQVVHRDLKPGNVMVTKDGRVKLLDFGLAKPLESTGAGDGDGTADATISAALTRQGSVIGTAAYMSPEQAKGEQTDSRSDIFSFGVMLYELATGTRPFRGTTTLSTLAKIMEAEPEPIPDTRNDIPQELRRIIRRCLQKRPEARYSDTRDLVSALKGLRQEATTGASRMASGAAGSAPRRFVLRGAVSWVAAGAGLVVIAVALGFLARRPADRRPAVEPPVHRQITFTASAEDADLAPDGKTVVFVERIYGSAPRLLVQDLAGGLSHEIYRGSAARPRWSPDGSRVLFTGRSAARRSALFVIPRLGGSPNRVQTPLSDNSRWYAGWSHDGRHVAVAAEGGNLIAIVDLMTGSSQTVSAGADLRFIWDLDWSPRGDLLCLCVESATERQIRVVTLQGAVDIIFRSAVSTSDPLARWAPTGDAVYFFRRVGGTTLDLWKLSVDPATGHPTGTPVSVLDGIPVTRGVSLSSDGKRLAYTRSDSSTNLWLVGTTRGTSREPIHARSLTTGTAFVERPRVSPDGKRVAYATEGTKGDSNIWSMDLEAGQPRQITFLEGTNTAPAWSPDGSRIAFASALGGVHQVKVVDADGGTPTPLPGMPWGVGPVTAWGPAPAVIYHCLENQDFCVLDLETNEEHLLLGGRRAGWVFGPQPTPDGRSIAFEWNRPDAPGLWVAPLDGGEPQLLKGSRNRSTLGWSKDGRFLFALDYTTTPYRVFRIAMPSETEELLFELPFDVDRSQPGSPDPTGTRFVFTRVDRKSDIWVTENFDPARN